jgi:prolipoprotein diacylglyceryl transferase
MLAFLPAPPTNAIHIGVFQLRFYGMCIALGVLAAIWLAGRRWEARGGDRREIGQLAVWGLAGGLVGARLYHVATDFELYRHDLLGIFRVWSGGLGIWGGVALGVVTGLVVAHRRGLDLPRLLDAVAPALALAQAIGRWGNWFNQELFGRPTTLPWGLHVDLAFRPVGYERFATFHPTFLYESIWDLIVVGIVILVGTRKLVRPGYLFAVYAAAYSFGRFFTEYLRIDTAHRIGGLRLNDWTSIAVFVVASAIAIHGRQRPERAPITIQPTTGTPI